MGKAACLVVLPDQLVGIVVHIRCSVCSVADGEDITVIIVGVGKGLIVTAGGVGAGMHLPGGHPQRSSLCYFSISIAGCQ